MPSGGWALGSVWAWAALAVRRSPAPGGGFGRSSCGRLPHPRRAPIIAWAAHGARRNPRPLARNRWCRPIASSRPPCRRCPEIVVHRQSSPAPPEDAPSGPTSPGKPGHNKGPRHGWPGWVVDVGQPGCKSGRYWQRNDGGRAVAPLTSPPRHPAGVGGGRAPPSPAMPARCLDTPPRNRDALPPAWHSSNNGGSRLARSTAAVPRA